MKALSFSPMAEADINGIWDYSAANWGPDQADHYTDEIRDACRALASGRKRGSAASIRSGYLKCSIGSHMIWFRDRGDRLEVVRVLHSAQDAERYLYP